MVVGHPPRVPEAGEGEGLAGPVAELPADAQRLLQVAGRARIVPGQLPRVPEVAEGEGLAGRVAELPGGLHGGGVAGDGLVPGAVVLQQARQARGQRDDPGALPGRGGLIQAG